MACIASTIILIILVGFHNEKEYVNKSKRAGSRRGGGALLTGAGGYHAVQNAM